MEESSNHIQRTGGKLFEREAEEVVVVPEVMASNMQDSDTLDTILKYLPTVGQPSTPRSCVPGISLQCGLELYQDDDFYTLCSTLHRYSYPYRTRPVGLDTGETRRVINRAHGSSLASYYSNTTKASS